jgi:hypothetical protein
LAQPLRRGARDKRGHDDLITSQIAAGATARRIHADLAALTPYRSEAICSISFTSVRRMFG